MSHSSLLTRCPNCQTQFRVTEEQLGIANGKVRCGNCMEIFNAVQHQTTLHARQTVPAEPSQPSTTSGFATEEEFVFQDNPEEDATERGYAGSSLTFSDDELSDSFREVQEGSVTGFEADEEPESGSELDESWAEAILEEDPAAPAPESPEPPPAPPAPTRPTPEPKSEPEPPGEEPETPERREPTFDELSLEPGPETTAAAATARSRPTRTAEASHEAPVNHEGQATTEPEQAKAEAARPSSPFDDLGREPIAVGRQSRAGWLRTTLWTLLVLGLLGALGAQVGYYQFDRLAAIPELRPYYELACRYAGCELEPLVDVDRIQSRKLVVRTDPDNRNALVVDAEIINRAPFEQPFPAIALTFSNLNGDVVAQRIFPPETYLAGQAREMAAMPKDVPVRIAIRIRDPGRDAVNYNIVFRPYSP
ncbi:MAG: DUF3426 domain-containing protein [Marinobacter sp.]|uniref:DUF3426 domain-containing protein n=1 Tax=Marinobacter sp. TaxID=50741 RepID=UPI00299DD0C5|nr:DUF3426 domain-containing protein [Marinobacter sp.]MDX1757214.1 DUF3426 domain-containing protein [Marinobacter sp.]